MQKLNKQKCEFVPITDEILERNPALIFNLIPYRRDYRCHRQLADTSPVKINRAGLRPDEPLQLPLLLNNQSRGE